MKRRLALTLTFLLFACLAIRAQVTIGSGEVPHNDALLDLKENSAGSAARGLLLPRVTLSATTLSAPMSAHVAGMSVYNTSTAGDVTPGYYYNDGTKWVKLSAEANSITPEWFYMPSIVLPTDASDTAYDQDTEKFTIDLHNEYAIQFGLLNSTSSVKSPSATALPVLGKTDLEYYVVYYDNTVFTDVALTDAGVLTYKLGSPVTYSEKTFMNIVFRVK